MAVYDARPDVQQTFPDIRAADRAAFREWTFTSGLEEHGIDEAFAPCGSPPETPAQTLSASSASPGPEAEKRGG
jgi:hypothetical protein